jgi:hypothetical protein
MRHAGAPRIVAFSGAAAVTAYGALWVAYYQFYSRIQVSPEDVGIDKTDLLSQALVGPFSLFATLVLTYGVVAIVSVVVMTFQLRHLRRAVSALIDVIRNRPEPTHPAPQRRLTLHERIFLMQRSAARFSSATWRYTRVAGGGVCVLYIVVVALALARLATASGTDLISGEPVARPHFQLFGVSIPLLDIRATPAIVTWSGTGDSERALPRGEHGSCLLYLGRGDGAVVLYDPSTGTVHHLPSTQVAVRLEPAENYPKTCSRSALERIAPTSG